MLTPLKVRRVTVKEQAACCQRAVGLGRRLRTYNIAPAAALKCCNSALSLLLLFAADSLINVLSSRRRTASSVQTSSVQRSRTANTVYSAIDCCTTNEIVAGTVTACLSQHCQTSAAANVFLCTQCCCHLMVAKQISVFAPGSHNSAALSCNECSYRW